MKNKQTKLWSKTRKEWIKNNPPDYGDYWYCVIGGGALSNDSEKIEYGALILTLDHKVSRSRAPTMRHNQLNLVPMCGFHNSDKGSKTFDEYIRSKPNKKCRN